MLPLQHFRAVRICRLACEGDAMHDDDAVAAEWPYATDWVSVLPGPQREAPVSHDGTGGQPGPWHRLACADVDLPAHLLERQRSGKFLCYELRRA